MNWENGVLDLSDPHNREVIMGDFAYLAQNYFSHPNYIRIFQKKPVFLYASRFWVNDDEVIKQLKESYNLYLIVENICWETPTKEKLDHMRLFDANFVYNMYIPDLEILRDFENKLDQKYKEWYDGTKSVGIGFIPTTLAGYNDTTARPEANNPVLPVSKERLRNISRIALNYKDPEVNMITLTSFNEWHEDQAIEPDMNEKFGYLEVVKKELYKES